MSDLYGDTAFCEYHSPNEIISTEKISTNRKRKRPIKNDLIQQDIKFIDKWSQRKQLFEEQWNKIENKINSKIDSLFEKTVQFLHEFIKNEIIRENKHTRLLNINKIPVAIMVLNCQLVQKKMINNLKSMIPTCGGKSIFVELDSFHDSMHCIYQQFFKNINKFVDLDHNLKTIEDILRSMVNNNFIDNGDYSATTIHLLVVIYNFEKFDMNVLNKIIMILKIFTSDISVGFIFFKSNLLNANLNNYLPMSSIDHLFIRIIDDDFQKSKILSLLEEIIVDDEIQFKFHPTMVRELIQHFRRIEFSIENFRITLRTLVFYYFYMNPLSVVCYDCPKKFQSIVSLDQNLLNCFKNSLNIFEMFMFDDEYADFISKSYHKLLKKNKEYSLIINILLKLFKHLNIPTKDYFHFYTEVYCHSSDYNFQTNLLDKLYDITQNQMYNALKKLKLDFEKFDDNHLIMMINIYIAKLDDLIQQGKLEEINQNKSIKQLGLQCQVEMVKDKLRNINSRYEWKKSLKPVERKNLSQYEQWKSDFIAILETTLVQSTLFNENERYLIDSLFCNTTMAFPYPSCRQNLDQALTKSISNQSRLGNVCHHLSFHILYRFYKEDNNINLHEWFTKFCQEKKSSRKSPSSHNDLVAIFLNTIFDFEFIGLLKCSTHNKYSKVVYL